MKLFTFDIFKRYTSITIMTWFVLVLFDILFKHLLKGEEGVIFGSFFSVAFVSLICTVIMNQSRWILFWRRTSESIRQFWLLIILILLFNLIVNYACYFLFLKFAGGRDQLFENFQPTYLECLWLTLILLSSNLVMTIDLKTMQTNLAQKPVKEAIFSVVGFYVWLVIVFLLLSYSRLLSYAFIEFSALAIFFNYNTFVLSSIRRSVKNWSVIVGMCILMIFLATSYLIEKNEMGNPSAFLGKLGPQKKWNSSDLEGIDSPSFLADYFLNVKNLNGSQLLQAIAKLAVLCPVSPTDTPTIIDCHEKKPTNSGTLLPLKLDDIEISQYLDSKLEYAKLIGMVAARRFEVFPEEIRQKLEIMSQQPGNLSPVAMKTLAYHGKGREKKIGMRIREAP